MKTSLLQTASRFLLLVILGSGAWARAADCPSVSLPSVDSGWYDSSGYHFAGNDNYFCGSGGGVGAEARNWFLFNIPVPSQPVASASLRLWTGSSVTSGGGEIYELRHVATPAAVLAAGGSGLTGIFADLGDGPLYGSRRFLPWENGQFVDIALGPPVLAALASAAGGTLALGGRVITTAGSASIDDYLFGGTGGFGGSNSMVELLLNYSNSAPITVVQQPQGQALYHGDSTVLQVRACGGGPAAYQWQRFGTNLPGATNPFVQLLNVTAASAGPYQALISDGSMTATSFLANVMVSNGVAPTASLYVWPGSSWVLEGDVVSVCASVSGLPFPQLRWLFNGTNLPGQFGSCVDFFGIQTSQAGTYQVVASNAAGVFTSAPVSLVVTQQPPWGYVYVSYGSTTPPAGSWLALCTEFTGSRPMSLQWQFNGVNLTGETGTCLSFPNVQTNQSGSYRIVLRNSSGGYTSAPIAVAVFTAPPAASIYLWSGATPALAGSFVGLCSTVSGAPAPTLQWTRDGASLPGQGASCLYLYNVSSNDAGLYRLVASNSMGVVTSAPLALAVSYRAPTGSVYGYSGQSPANAGSSITYCSSVSGAPAPQLQWRFNGVEIPGATALCLTRVNLSSNDIGFYDLVASNAAGAWTSAPLALAINYLPPVGFISPSGPVGPIDAGGSLSLCSSIVAAPAASLRWQFNDTDIPGQTNSCLYLNGLTTNQSGSYRLVASNVAGMFTSAVASVSVVHRAPAVSVDLGYGQSPAIVGGALSLCASLSGGPTPTLQWQFQGTNLPNQTGYCLYLSNAQTNQSGGYTVVASNILGVVTSAVATISIVEPRPVLAYFASGLSPFRVGSFEYLCASVSFPEAATLQWQRNGTNLADATGYCFYLNSVTPDDAGDYTLVATTLNYGSYTSAPLTVATYYAPPTYATVSFNLGGPTALLGQDVGMVASYGGSPCFVQWRFNGVNMPGQTNGTLSLLGITTNQAGQYSYVATNIAGAITSSVATVTVGFGAPVFHYQPANVTVAEGGTARFWAYAQAGPPADHYLERNGTNVAVPYGYEGCCGPVTGGFNLFDTTFADAGSYRIVASNYLGMATSVVAVLTVTPAGPLDRWTQRNPLPQSQPLLAVAHGSNHFVAVGERGTIITSPDGTNWVLQNRRADVPLHGVAHGNGVFVAVGEGGTILSSGDGTNWAYRHSAPGVYLGDVAYGAGRFVAVGTGPGLSTLVMHSTNGVQWERVPLNGFNAQNAVVYGNGQFIAAGAGSILRSVDGVNWSYVQNVTREMESVTYGNGSFVAVGDDGATLVSANGLSFVARLPVTTRRLTAVTYGAGRFVTAGSRGVMLTSTDTLTWTPVISGTPDRFEGIQHGGGLFVAVGENGIITTSADGLNWGQQNQGVTRDLDGMHLAGGVLVIVGKGGSIMTSTDGRLYVPQNAGVTNDLHGVTWGGGLWVVVGEQGVVLTSSNAVHWQSHDSGNTNSLKDAVYAAGRWVVVGTQGTTVSSTNGVTWETRYVSPAYDLNAIAHGNGLFLIAADGFGNRDGSLYYSTDGVTWWTANFFFGKNLRGITFAQGTFLIPANDGAFFTTSNAFSFSTGLPFGSYVYGRNLRAATFAHGLWIIVGNDGTILTSPDRVSWTRRATRTFENQHEVVAFDGTLLVIGNRGGVLQSDRITAEVVPPVFTPGAGFRFAFAAVAGRTYHVQSSSNLVHWAPLVSYTNAAGPIEFTDSESLGLPRRFYRLLEE